jgi:hypothetical protein
MNTRNLPMGKEWPACDLEATCEPTVYKMREFRRLATLCTSMACYRDSFTFLFFFNQIHEAEWALEPVGTQRQKKTLHLCLEVDPDSLSIQPIA